MPFSFVFFKFYRYVCFSYYFFLVVSFVLLHIQAFLYLFCLCFSIIFVLVKSRFVSLFAVTIGDIDTPRRLLLSRDDDEVPCLVSAG